MEDISQRLLQLKAVHVFPLNLNPLSQIKQNIKDKHD